MKKFIQGLFVNFALIVLGAYIIPCFYTGYWSESVFVIQLFAATLLIRLLQLLTNMIRFRYPIFEYLIELGMVLAVVLGLGRLLNWYAAEYIWVMIVIIVAVYAAVYIVGVGKTKRDVDFINKQIKLRRESKLCAQNTDAQRPAPKNPQGF